MPHPMSTGKQTWTRTDGDGFKQSIVAIPSRIVGDGFAREDDA